MYLVLIMYFVSFGFMIMVRHDSISRFFVGVRGGTKSPLCSNVFEDGRDSEAGIGVKMVINISNLKFRKLCTQGNPKFHVLITTAVLLCSVPLSSVRGAWGSRFCAVCRNPAFVPEVVMNVISGGGILVARTELRVRKKARTRRHEATSTA